MKKFVSSILLGAVISTFVASAPFALAREGEPAEYQTKKLQLGCGLADDVWAYLVREMGEHQAVLNESLRPVQGETFRRLVMYPDTSWFLTFEFLSSGSVSDDVSCIVDKGFGESVWEAIDKSDYPIPGHPIGSP